MDGVPVQAASVWLVPEKTSEDSQLTALQTGEGLTDNLTTRVSPSGGTVSGSEVSDAIMTPTEVAVKIRKGETVKVNVTVSAVRKSLDLIFVEDLSDSFENDLVFLANIVEDPSAAGKPAAHPQYHLSGHLFVLCSYSARAKMTAKYYLTILGLVPRIETELLDTTTFPDLTLRLGFSSFINKVGTCYVDIQANDSLWTDSLVLPQFCVWEAGQLRW